jgi:hypothetical protein
MTYYYSVTSSRYQPGFAAGVAATLTTGHFTLQTNLLYARKGYQLQRQFQYIGYTGGAPLSPISYTSTAQLNYFTLPVNLVLTQRTTGQGGQIFIGPYIGWLLGGRVIENLQGDNGIIPSTTPYPLQRASADQSPDTFYAHALDVGLQTGVGYRYKGALLQLGYSWGLRQLAVTRTVPPSKAATPAVPTQNRGLQVCLSYLFNVNKH